MKQKTNFLKKFIWNKTALCTALIHFAISFLTDRMLFRYTWMDFSSVLSTCKSLETIAVKIVFLFLLILMWQGLFYFVKRGEKQFRNAALFYFVIMMCLLCLIWPGIWRMDEFGLLSSSIQLYPHWWQNYITSVWYIFSLMLFPFPAGVIITMCAINALLYARLICNAMFILQTEYETHQKTERQNAGKSAKNRQKFASILLTIPFVMFPVLDSNLYPLRMSLYAFLELTLLSELFLLYKMCTWGRQNKQIKGGYAQNIWAVALLASVVTVWRTEAIYYLILFPLILLIIGGLRRFWKPMAVYVILFVILFVPQKIGEKITSGEQYELTSIVLPLVPLTLEAMEEGEQELLGRIDRVVDTSVIERAAKEGKNGISMFWSEPDFQKVYTSQDFASFKSAYYQLVVKYPKVFLQERWDTFVSSTDLLENTTELYTRNDVPNYETFKTYPCSKPLSDDLRTFVIKTLEIRTGNTYSEKSMFTQIVYTPIIPILLGLVVAIILLWKRRWIPLVILLAVLMKVPLVFLTAPSRLFMYYYSVYLIGYVVWFYGIASLLYRRSAKKLTDSE